MEAYPSVDFSCVLLLYNMLFGLSSNVRKL